MATDYDTKVSAHVAASSAESGEGISDAILNNGNMMGKSTIHVSKKEFVCTGFADQILR